MSNYTILIIDYEPRSIQKLRNLFETAGHDVEVARDGLSGIERFQVVRPDLTLIEAMLPKKHGFEVCQAIKKTTHGQATPVMILTAVYKGRKYRWQARHDFGCDEYIEKPIPDDQLLEIVERFLLKRSTAEESGLSPPAGAPELSVNPGNAESEIHETVDGLFGANRDRAARPSIDPAGTPGKPPGTIPDP